MDCAISIVCSVTKDACSLDAVMKESERGVLILFVQVEQSLQDLRAIVYEQ